MENQNCILLTCDKSYLKFVLFVVWQLESQVTKNFDIVISSDDSSIEEFLPTNLVFLHLSDITRWKQLGNDDRLNYSTYLRLPALEILSSRYRRVLYLDADIYIANRNISPIFDLPMGDYALCAVRDTQQRFNVKNHVSDFKNNDLAKSKYFNAGVLLIQSQKWIENSIYEELCDALSKFPQPIKLHDQTLLNLVFHNRWLEISPKWNWMSGSLTNFASQFFSIYFFHGKTWEHDPRRIPIMFHNEFKIYNSYYNYVEKVEIIDYQDGDYFKEFWRSLALNLRWSFSTVKWLKRFEDDYSPRAPDISK